MSTNSHPAVNKRHECVRKVLGKCQVKDLFRIGFGLIWVVDAIFKWEPAFRKGFTGDITMAAQGQPSWLHGWFHMWVEFTQAHSEFLAYSTAAIETLLAAAVIFGFARKCTYTGGAIFSLLIWATAEGFGGPYSSSSTDIGSAVMYAVVFLGLLVIDHEAGASAFSVDHWMEQRLSWWHRVAEVRLGGSSGLPTTETVKADSAST